MSDLAATFGAIFLGFLSIILGTVFFSVLRSGPAEVAQLRRKHYGLRPWMAGDLKKPSRSATMRELEGLELKAKSGRLIHARRTRAPSYELL